MATNSTEAIDVIVTTCNCLPYLKECLKSIKKYTTNISYRLIVVNNGSSDGTKEYLENLKYENLIVKNNNDNQGNPKALTQGYAISKSNFVCVMNDDVIVSKGWLSGLVKVMKDNPDVGILGPIRPGAFFIHPYTKDLSKIVLEESKKSRKTPNGQLKYFTKNKNYDSFVEDYKRANNLSLVRYKSLPDIISTCCALVRRTAVDKAGGIVDMQFKKYGADDTDLCWRLIKKGYSLAITSKSYIHHFEHVSMQKNNIDRQKYLRLNSKRLYKKWQQELESHLQQKANNGLTKEQILQESWLLQRLSEAVGKSFWSNVNFAK